MALYSCFDGEARAQIRTNKAIELKLEQWKNDSSKIFKLLLLGEFV